MIDLTNFTAAELRALQSKITTAIKERGQADISEAREKILAIAKSVVYSVGQLVGGIKDGKIKVEVPVKYQDKEDATKTWTGRGRQPNWIKVSLAGGKTLDDLRV